MSKFSQQIKSTGVLTERTQLVAQQAKRAMQELIQNLEGNIDEKKMVIIQMCDIAPDSTVSTKPQGLAATNPKAWVKELHTLKVEVSLLEAELKIANDTRIEWFTDEDSEKGDTLL